MSKSQLVASHLHTKIQTNHKLFKKQKTFSVGYTRQKEENIESLNMKNLSDSTEIWKMMKPFV